MAAAFEIESVAHVFQSMLTNSQDLTAISFIGQTTDNWIGASYISAFNISRVFKIINPEEG